MEVGGVDQTIPNGPIGQKEVETKKTEVTAQVLKWSWQLWRGYFFIGLCCGLR